jgi:ATP-binding cassette subfamily C protein
LQSAVLGIGAYLVIHQQATAGIIIAASILTARALAPIELVIGSWKNFVAARQGWRRLAERLRLVGTAAEPMRLEDAQQSLAVVGAAVVPPGGKAVAVNDVTFTLSRGDGLGIIGPSASGKSSLARALVGVWPLVRGSIRLDGATLDQWEPDQLGRNIGYLPQDVELFGGTVAANISRFEAEPDSAKVVEAARIAGVHELILALPQGYDTDIGEGGMALSAGQRQRIALARCLYRNPFLIVLDEPNSNLDAAGDEALTKAIVHARQRGAIVIVIAHRPAALAGVNLVMVVAENRMKDFGPKDDVMKRLLRPGSRAPETPRRFVSFRNPRRRSRW